MKISNVSKIMLIVAMALAGNAAYRALQNRTSSSSTTECPLPENCSATVCQECLNEGVSPEALAAVAVEVPALETAMYSDSDDEDSVMQRAMQAEEDEEEDDEENEEEDSNDGMGENDIP